MSSDNDKCFQCQETGHMACYCPHQMFDCNDYGHVAADCPDKIPPSGTPAHQTTPLIDMTDHHLGITAKPGIPTMIIGTDTDLVVLNPTPTTPDIEATVIMIPAEAVLGHFIDLCAVAPCVTEIPACTATAATHHIADPHHRDSSPERTVDQEHTNPAGNITNQHKDHLLAHTEHPGNITTEDTNML